MAANSTGAQARMVVPDIARGAALLGIAVANIPTAWLVPGAPHSSYFGSTDTVLDQVLAMLSAMFAHNRGLPLFSTLLGFGVGLIAMSLWRRQFPAKRARQIIVRRYFFLAIFGVIHGVLLFFGDIMFYYGLCGMLLALLLTLSDKLLAIISYVLMGLALIASIAFLSWALTSGVDLGAGQAGSAAASEFTTYLDLLQYNATTVALSLTGLPSYFIFYLPIIVIGFTWARRGVLADVPAHRKELIAWAIFGAVIIFGIGIPWGLAVIGILPVEYATVFMATNSFAGAMTGPALLAMFALALQPIQARVNRGEQPPAWARMPMALGERSMSGYLFQSIAFFIIFYPIAFGFKPESMSTQVSLALAVWAMSMFGAWALAKIDKPGPFEWAHRRLAYGPTMQPKLQRAQTTRQHERQEELGSSDDSGHRPEAGGRGK